MTRTLVIGYGNRDRQDDGVAHAIIGGLRRCLGQTPLAEGETGLEQLEGQANSIFVLQLTPELLDVALNYEQLVFVDAHVHPEADDLHCTPVEAEYASAAFTHHMTPAMFLALLQALYQHRPLGQIVSVRGYSFDFERKLSPATQASVEPAVDKILALLGQHSPASGRGRNTRNDNGLGR
jgi:hydrogenase maturation protease